MCFLARTSRPVSLSAGAQSEPGPIWFFLFGLAGAKAILRRAKKP
jgi:hypothetical protein